MSNWSTKHLFPVSYLPPTHILPLIIPWPPSFPCLHPNLKPKTVSSATALFSLEDQLNTTGFFTDLSTFNKWLSFFFFLIQSQTSLLDIQREKIKADEMLIWNCLLSALWGRICSSPLCWNFLRDTVERKDGSSLPKYKSGRHFESDRFIHHFSVSWLCSL